jgi:hypothetical protein
MEGFSDFNSETNQVTYSNFGEFEKYQDLVGQIQYTELIKKFPHLIKSKRGKLEILDTKEHNSLIQINLQNGLKI